MKNFIILLFLFSGLKTYAQHDVQQIIQKALDFSVLSNHIDSQEIITTNGIKFIRDNGLLDTTLHLTYKGKKLKFTNGIGAEGFFNGWTFEFLNVNVQSTQAEVSYKFIPYWNYCQGKITLAQSGSLFFIVELEFHKISGDVWEIINSEISDIDFEVISAIESGICLKSKYKPLKKNH